MNYIMYVSQLLLGIYQIITMHNDNGIIPS